MERRLCAGGEGGVLRAAGAPCVRPLPRRQHPRQHHRRALRYPTLKAGCCRAPPGPWSPGCMQPWAQSLAAVTSSSCCAAAQSFCNSHALVHDAGTVLITFKSRLSLPPYRIENATSDVAIWFAQVCILARDQTAEPDGTAAACHHPKIVHASDCLLSELERVK